MPRARDMTGSRKNRPRTRTTQSSARGSRQTPSRGIRSVTATGCLFWACLIIIFATVIYVAREPLTSTFKKLLIKEEVSPSVVVTPLTPENKEPSKEDKEEVEIDQEAVEAPPARQVEKESVASKPAAAPPEKPVLRKARLFFVTVDPAGKIVMKGVIRPIPVSDTPLRDVLTALLAGPTSQEVNLGFLTMVPSEAKLKSVIVRADTAVLDFTESFRFNTLGMEGLTAQLSQVVYAATEFPTVKKVQILIEGKKVQYLGTEGVRIDQPLSRESFGD